MPRGAKLTEHPEIPDFPPLLHRLISELEKIRRRANFIPQEFKDSLEVRAHIKLVDDDDFNELTVFTKQPNHMEYFNLKLEFTNMMQVLVASRSMSNKGSLENCWNYSVHFKLLDQAQAAFANLVVEGVAQLKPQTQYLPTENTQPKLVDFAVRWQPGDSDGGLIIRLLNPQHPSINHVISEDQDYRECPMVIPIETKRRNGDHAQGFAQLTLCAMALFKRLRHFSGEKSVVSLPIPMLMVLGDRWFLYFAIDGSENTKILSFGEIGDTSDLQKLYTLLKSIKALFRFVQYLRVPEYRKTVLCSTTKGFQLLLDPC
ncbi:hypothetical protein C7974DRAFT_54269 [Boeremia exigua]|uniref:uncharacterized protein n=1 Tax=Boeremia exigua TaxID=749465 RepID=UPI001E8D7551|nr:uncharacterized protein C7974DRAFT_54269 [Boeremia exigua]KAH6614802.1 hypothetical protein C7974DRAFT_54269 [Boeremia exigua]